uniref:Uncharacterized protein n=1 Tax=Arundo donax TaxID=35708 RepID=A0A0A8YGC8_ARUDO
MSNSRISYLILLLWYFGLQSKCTF